MQKGFSTTALLQVSTLYLYGVYRRFLCVISRLDRDYMTTGLALAR